jgi:hypothetical protein
VRALALVVLVAGCASWKHEDTHATLWATSSALILCDYGQTVWASNSGQWDRPSPDEPNGVLREMNPLIGQTPSVGKLTAIAMIDLAINFGVLAAPLPAWVKTAWFGSVTVAETYMVTTNNFHGTCGIGDWSPGRLRL